MRQLIYSITCFGLLFFIALHLGACKKKDPQVEAFVRVYDDSNGNNSYVPLSLLQTEDGGFLFLSAKNGWFIHILKTDKNGVFQWEKSLDENYVSPLNGFIVRPNGIFMLCMDAIGLFTHVLKIDLEAADVVPSSVLPEVRYPLAMYADNDEVLIQGYNRLGYQTEIHRITPSLDGVALTKEFPVLENVEERLVHHLTYTGKRLPFFVEKLENNTYVFNGFFRFSFSFVMLNNQLNYTGVYSGEGYNGGVQAALSVNANATSLARFSFDHLYFNPLTTLNPTAVDITSSLPAQGFADLNPSTPVLIKRFVIDAREYIVFMASTHSQQMTLRFYTVQTGGFSGQKSIGQQTGFVLGDAVRAADGSLIVLAQTRVMGSFKRLAFVKIPPNELIEAVK